MPHMPAGRAALDTLAWMIDEAFEGDLSHSLLANLAEVRDEDWGALPAGAGRTIAEIVEHAAWAKWMYADYAFGSAALRGDVPPMVPEGGARARPAPELLAWLKAGHARWVGMVRALADDGELERDRLANWGERLPTRVLIRLVIAHDLYHAGEINHLRALLHGSDRWRY